MGWHKHGHPATKTWSQNNVMRKHVEALFDLWILTKQTPINLLQFIIKHQSIINKLASTDLYNSWKYNQLVSFQLNHWKQLQTSNYTSSKYLKTQGKVDIHYIIIRVASYRNVSKNKNNDISWKYQLIYPILCQSLYKITKKLLGL